jgi:hypothetical protein
MALERFPDAAGEVAVEDKPATGEPTLKLVDYSVEFVFRDRVPSSHNEARQSKQPWRRFKRPNAPAG